MSREILFRGQFLHHNEWVYGNLLTYGNGNAYICEHVSENTLRKVPVEPNTVGQYTGLKDRNGKRIFEGDLIADGSNKKGMPATIRYWEPDAAFRATRNGYSYLALDKDACRQSAVVVGNIHDKELMEGNK